MRGEEGRAEILERPSAGPAGHDEYQSIQCLRALAALMVLVYHVGTTLSVLHDGPVRPHWLTAGVDIFFVVSGFVMVVATRRRPIGRGRFLRARMARIVPLYWVATLLYAALLVLQRQGAPSLEELLKSLFFIFYTNPRTGEPTPLLVPGWSLNYEVYFYVMFAAVLWLSVARRILVLGAIFAFICMFRPLVPADDALLFRLTSPHPLEFVAGMALAYAASAAPRLPAWSGAILIAVAFAGLATIGTGLSRVLFFGPFAIAIVAGAVIAEPLFRMAVLGPLRRLGDASYSLYLTHPLVVTLLLPLLAPGTAVAGAAITMAIASIAAAFLSYHAFELPIAGLARGWIRGRRSDAPATEADRPSG